MREIAEKILDETPRLFAAGERDYERATEAVEATRELPFGQNESISAQDRMVRLARSFNRLSELLGERPQQANPKAIELRAWALIHVAIAVMRVGEIAAGEQVLERLCALDEAAIAACDRIAYDALEHGADHDKNGGPNLIAAAILKAHVHANNRRKTAALSALDDVVIRFGDSEEFWISATLQAAVELREELLTDSETEPGPPGEPASLSTSNTGTARVVWRRGQ